MKAIHPDIVDRRFTNPQGSDENFDHFLEGFGEPRHELLNEISDGIGTDHRRAAPIFISGDEPAFLLELPRFIVVYQLPPGTVEVCTILSKRNPSSPDDFTYFTSSLTLPSEPNATTHPNIEGKEIAYVNLDNAFSNFAQEACGGLCPTLLVDAMESTIRLRHGEARAVTFPDHPRSIWELQTPHLRFQYQVLDDKVEVGAIWSRTTGVGYEPGQDLLAEYTK